MFRRYASKAPGYKSSRDGHSWIVDVSKVYAKG